MPEGDGQRYFALFKEQPLPRGPQQTHAYRITYDQGAAELRFYVDDTLVNTESSVPRMESFIAALGLAFVALGAEFTGHWPHRHDPDGHRLVFR